MNVNDNKIEKGKYKAISVAKYLLSLDPKREYFTTKKMRNKDLRGDIKVGEFRLNNILYLLQLLHYFKYNEFLFSDDLYAWGNGIVTYNPYVRFGELYYGENTKRDENIKDKEIKKFISVCFTNLRKFSNRYGQEFILNDPFGSYTGMKATNPKIDLEKHFTLETYRQSCSEGLNKVGL